MSRPTLWVHCGTYKTGSSSIQNHLFARRAELAALGWLYPSAGLRTDESDAGLRHSALAYKPADPQERRRLWISVRDEIRSSEATQILLSSEVWSRPTAARRLAALTVFLKDSVPVGEVRGVLYLRNRAAYARSLYRELVHRRGQTLDLPGFVERNGPLLDPVHLLTRLGAAVDVCAVWPYAGAPDVTSDFCARLGLPAPSATHSRSNVGEGAVVTEARRLVNELAPERAGEFPGAPALPASLLALEATCAERFPASFHAHPPGWEDELRRLTGWPADAVRSLLEPLPDAEHDLAELRPEIRSAVTAWLA